MRVTLTVLCIKSLICSKYTGMTKRTLLFVDWQAIDGAARGKRKLKLRINEEGTYTCPVHLCLHTNFKSQRGLRKHIDNKHSWYYYFERQPDIKREELEVIQPPSKRWLNNF